MAVLAAAREPGDGDFALRWREHEGLPLFTIQRPARVPQGLFARFAPDGFEPPWERALDELEPEVIHVHGLQDLSVDLPWLVRRRGAALVLTVHDHWLLCPRARAREPEGTRCAALPDGSCELCAPAAPATDLAARTAAEALAAWEEDARDLLLVPDRVVVPDAALRGRVLRSGASEDRVRVIPSDPPAAAALLAIYEEARAVPRAPLLEGPLAAFRKELDSCRSLGRAALLREAAGGLERVARLLEVDAAPAKLLDDARRHPLAARAALAALRSEADWLREQGVEFGRERKWLKDRLEIVGAERDWLRRDRKALQEEHARTKADRARHEAEFEKLEGYRTRLEARIQELEREFSRAVEYQKGLETELKDRLEAVHREQAGASEELRAAFDRAEGHRREMEALALRLGSELRELEQRLLVRTAERDRFQTLLGRLARSRLVRTVAGLIGIRDLKGFRS